MKLKIVMPILLLAGAITIFLSVLAYNTYPQLRGYDQILEKKYTFYVDDSPGMDLDTDIIRLGAVPPQATANRNVEIQAQGRWQIITEVRGEKSEWVSATVATNNFTDKVDLKISVSVPEGAEKGQYNGTVIILLRELE